MKKQQGFTLIELVVVIIILGILAVTAAPKFIDIQSDARESTLKGLEGALNGANNMVYTKASLAGLQKQATAIIHLEGKDGAAETEDDVSIVYGYVAADNASFNNIMQLGNGDWIFNTGAAAGTIELAQVGAPGVGTVTTANGISTAAFDATVECKLVYTPATATTLPVIDTLTSGC